MIQDDYLLRLIARFQEGMGRIAENKKQGDMKKAHHEAGELLNDVFGLHPTFLQTVSEYELQASLRAGKVFNAQKALMMAELLREHAETMRDAGSEEQEYVPVLITSLSVYIQALLDTRKLRTDEHIHNISALCEILDGYNLPVDVLGKLMDYYEMMGKFSEAENVLYELLEVDEERAVERGRNFYEALMTLPDEDLDAGELPRSEVEEGLEMLRERDSS